MFLSVVNPLVHVFFYVFDKRQGVLYGPTLARLDHHDFGSLRGFYHFHVHFGLRHSSTSLLITLDCIPL